MIENNSSFGSSFDLCYIQLACPVLLIPTFFVQPFHTTLEDVYESNVGTDRGTIENLRFYDTEGLEPKNTTNLTEKLPKHLLAVADGVVIVYSIDDESSFQVICCPFCFFGP